MGLKPADIDNIIDKLRKMTAAAQKGQDVSTLSSLQKELKLYLVPRWDDIWPYTTQYQRDPGYKREHRAYGNVAYSLQRNIEESFLKEPLDSCVIIQNSQKIINELECIKANLEYLLDKASSEKDKRKMDTQAINTPEKLYQAIGKFLQSDYSHENLVKMYDDTRKYAIGFRGVYSALPALPACKKEDPLDGLQDVMDWCNKSAKVVDDIVYNLEQQTINEIISLLKKIRDFADRVLSLVNNNLKEQSQKEARAKVEKEYKNLNEEALKTNKMLLVEQAGIICKLQLEELMISRREKEDAIQIYLSKDPTFKDKLSQLRDEEVNKLLEALNNLVGSDTSTGKLIDIYCKLKDIPIQQQFDEAGYAYYLTDLADVIFSNCNRLYTSIDNVIKTFKEIQTKAEQKKVGTKTANGNAEAEDLTDTEQNSGNTSVVNKITISNSQIGSVQTGVSNKSNSNIEQHKNIEEKKSVVGKIIVGAVIGIIVAGVLSIVKILYNLLLYK